MGWAAKNETTLGVFIVFICQLTMDSESRFCTSHVHQRFKLYIQPVDRYVYLTDG